MDEYLSGFREQVQERDARIAVGRGCPRIGLCVRTLMYMSFNVVL